MICLGGRAAIAVLFCYILLGPHFEETLLHTEFRILKIIDANHSLARIPPGVITQLNQKNNRAVIRRK